MMAVPKKQAVVTHGHADHARGGHGDVWATPETLAIMGLRYGTDAGTPLAMARGSSVAGSGSVSTPQAMCSAPPRS